MLLNSFYAILGTFYTLLNNTDLDLSYFDLSYVFPGHIDSVKRGLTVGKFLWPIFVMGTSTIMSSSALVFKTVFCMICNWHNLVVPSADAKWKQLNVCTTKLWQLKIVQNPVLKTNVL